MDQKHKKPILWIPIFDKSLLRAEAEVSIGNLIQILLPCRKLTQKKYDEK